MILDLATTTLSLLRDKQGSSPLVPDQAKTCYRELLGTLSRSVARVVLPDLRLVVQDDVQQGAADF